MKELSHIEIVLPTPKGSVIGTSRAGYSFGCTWTGSRERAESDFIEAQSECPSVSWIVWRISLDWNVTVGSSDWSEIERFRSFLLQRKGWSEQKQARKAG